MHHCLINDRLGMKVIRQSEVTDHARVLFTGSLRQCKDMERVLRHNPPDRPVRNGCLWLSILIISLITIYLTL